MSGRFRSRPTRMVGIRSINGWRLKDYEITLGGAPIAGEIRAAVDRCLSAALPPVPAGELGVGFVIAHHGAESVWILADLWTGDIVSQHTFSAPLDRPTALAAVAPGGPTACVWELPVHAHERDAFVQHILDPEAGPDVSGYLEDAFAVGPRSGRELVQAFNQAWAAGDIDGLMALMHDRPTYRASTGAGPGVDYRGTAEVRAGFRRVIDAEAAAGRPAPPAGEVHVFGDRGLSFWSYGGRNRAGDPVLVEGVDIWTFADGRIVAKDAYRKSFPDPPT